MKTQKDIPEREATYLILLIRVPENAVTTLAGLPANNSIGMHCLTEALARHMELAGAKTTSTKSWGPLNESSYVFEVANVQTALSAMESVIQKTGIMDFATIHYWDDREDFLRLRRAGFGIDPNAPIDWPAFIENNRAALASRDAKLWKFRFMNNPFKASVDWLRSRGRKK